jgi:hypothetical protein
MFLKEMDVCCIGRGKVTFESRGQILIVLFSKRKEKHFSTHAMRVSVDP